tara:strand:- start:974 stop:1447 length:474 start_codon:yes stop_codon:yes gene_type:complete
MREKGDEKEMKKIGTKVVTGRINTNTYQGQENKIHLFDGKFTTGYRVVSFTVVPKIPSATYELTGKVSTEPLSTISEFRWDDVREVAWAGWNFTNSSSDLVYENIREDNMAVEDLWVSVYFGGGTIEINYEIVLEKYEFHAYDGAAFQIRNKSQAGA